LRRNAFRAKLSSPAGRYPAPEVALTHSRTHALSHFHPDAIPMSAPFIRPRTVPEILDAAFQILRQHYVPIVTATGIVLLPSIVLAILLPPELVAISNFAQNLLLNFAAAATVLMVADIYLGREPDMKAALEKVGGRVGTILGAAFLQGILIGLGILLCIVLGIIAFALLFAVPMVVMVEGTGAMDALGRSNDLAEGNLLRVLGTSVLAYIIAFAAMFGLGIVIGLVAGSVEGPMAKVLISIVSIFVLPFPVVVSTLLYFDLRIRKEGYGLDNLADLRGPERPRFGGFYR